MDFHCSIFKNVNSDIEHLKWFQTRLTALCNAYTSAFDSKGKCSRSCCTKSPFKIFIAERPVIFRVEVSVVFSLFLKQV